MMFSAFSPLNGGSLDTYYRDNEYPYDLNGALDYVRPAQGVAVFPFPLTIGHVEGLVPQFNLTEFSFMLGKTPYGPWTGQLGSDPAIVFPQIFGGMKKVTG